MSHNARFIHKWIVRPSPIHGVGVFPAQAHPIRKNEHVGVAIVGGGILSLPFITPELGSLINHSNKPTARLQRSRSGGSSYFLAANRNLGADTEITLDYRDTPWWVAGPDPHW